LRARDQAAGDPVAADFHGADLRVGVARLERGGVAAEDVGELEAAADRDTAIATSVVSVGVASPNAEMIGREMRRA
jgi:hypothetical protein